MVSKKPARYQKNHPDPRKRPPVRNTYKRKVEKVEKVETPVPKRRAKMPSDPKWSPSNHPTPTDAVLGPMKRPDRDICGLSGDLMEMVAKATETRRMDLWREEHKKTFAEVLEEYDEVSGNQMVEDTIHETEIAEWREDHLLEEDEDFCLNYQGEEWIDGRTIRAYPTYGGELAMRAKEEFIYMLRNRCYARHNGGNMPTPKWLEQVRENKMAKYRGGGCAAHTEERHEQIHQQLNNWLTAA